MFKKNSLFLTTIYVYLISVFIALVFSPAFKLFYDKILNPPKIGYGLFFGRNEELIVGGIIFSYIFFLPLITLILIKKKQWWVWLIGIIFPLIIVLSEKNYIIWFLVFTIAGGLIGWLVNLVVKKWRK